LLAQLEWRRKRPGITVEGGTVAEKVVERGASEGKREVNGQEQPTRDPRPRPKTETREQPSSDGHRFAQF
jgi:hypothetical protein